MNKIIIKEIRPTKKHKCESVAECKELANDWLKITGEKKIYLCEKHVAQFYIGVANSYIKKGE